MRRKGIYAVALTCALIFGPAITVSARQSDNESALPFEQRERSMRVVNFIAVIAFGLALLGFCRSGAAGRIENIKSRSTHKSVVHLPQRPATGRQQPARPAVKAPAPLKSIQRLPDLGIQRIWLDHGNCIVFELRNTGPGSVPPDLRAAAHVRLAWRGGHKDFALATVDPHAQLTKPGGSVRFTTNIHLKSSERVTAALLVGTGRQLEKKAGNNSFSRLLTPKIAAGSYYRTPKSHRPAAQPAARSILPPANDSHHKVPKSRRQAGEPQTAGRRLPRLSIEKIFVQNGKVHVRLQNSGSIHLGKVDTQTARLSVTCGTRTRSWPLAHIDSRRQLVHPDGSFDFDTGLAVNKPTRVVARLEKAARAKTRTAVLRPQPSLGESTRLPHLANPAPSPNPGGAGGPGEGLKSGRSIQVLSPAQGDFVDVGNPVNIIWAVNGDLGTDCMRITLRQLGSAARSIVIAPQYRDTHQGQSTHYQRGYIWVPDAALMLQGPANRIRVETCDGAVHGDSGGFLITGPLPEYSVENLRISPSSPYKGDTIHIDADFVNMGTNSDLATVTGELKITDPDGVVYTRGLDPQALGIGQLGFRGRFHYHDTYTLAKEGDYTVSLDIVPRPGGIAVDPYPANNHAAVAFHASPPLPDLVVCMAKDTHLKTPVTFEFPLNVKNIGNAPSAATSLSLKMGGHRIVHQFVPQLQPGHEFTSFTTYTWWNSGQNHFRLWVDWNQQVTEQHEDNNILRGRIVHTLPTEFDVTGLVPGPAWMCSDNPAAATPVQ